MTYDPSDTPAAHLDRLGESVERDPEYRARQERIAKLSSLQKAQRTRRRLLDPWRVIPPVGLTIAAIGATLRAIGWI